MNEIVPTNLKESVENAVRSTALELSGFVIFMMVVGFAVAPLLSPFIRYHLEHKYDVNNNITLMNVVNNKMIIVNAILWTIAILTWIFGMICYAVYNS